MKSHQIEFHGRTIRYFDAYDADHLDMFVEAHKQQRPCVIVGPTGFGKTTFLEYACASCLSARLLPIMSYVGRYGFADIGASVARVINIAASLAPAEYLSVAFYPKSAEAAQATGADTWPDTKAAIDQVLHGLEHRGLLPRLAGLELSVEPEFVDIYEDIRAHAQERRWYVLEFQEWDETMQQAYMDFVVGFGERSA
jgi:hypothetical protein